MSEHEIFLKAGRINFAPESETEEILQNVITICTTMKYSVPMDRDFGVKVSALDEPVSRVKALYTSEIVQAVRKFEPRARIKRVEYDGSVDGKVYPRILVKIL